MRNYLSSSPNEFPKTVGLMLCLLGIWIFTHPYLGIYHDGRLYAVQALQHLFPENYKNDLLLLHGSPDQYTVFGRIYACAIKLLGLDNATIALLAIGLLLWFLSAVYMAHSLTNGSSFWLFSLFMLALPGYYGSNVLSYGESFLSPRLFSESFVLLSIGLLMRNRDFLSFLLLLAALMIHPLISAAGFVAFFVFKSLDSRKWLLVPLLAISLTFIVARLEIPPFSGILEVMDREWFKVVNDRTEYLFVNNWSISHFDAILFDASIIGSALLIETGKLRRLLSTSLITGLGCLTLSWVGADLLHNVFLIQIQLWRCLWVMHLFANLAGATLAANLWNRSKFSRLLLMGYLTTWFALGLTSFAGCLAVWIFLIHFYTSRISHKEIGIPGSAEISSYAAPFILGTYWLIFRWHDAHFASLINHDEKPFYELFLSFLLSTRIIPIVLFLFLWKLFIRVDRKPVSTTIILCLLCLNMLLIYRWDHNLENPIDNKDTFGLLPFQNKIHIGSVVSWPDYYGENAINKVWFFLRRSSYADVVQGAGIFYSRQNAIKYAARSNNLKVLNIFSDKRLSSPADKTIPRPSFSDLVKVCQDPELDFIVLNFRFPSGAVASYHDVSTRKTYFLYDCRLIRSLGTKQASHAKI